MSDLLLYCIETTVASTVVSGAPAIVWAKSRSPYLYILSMAIIWAAISALLLSARSWEISTFPADRAHFVATMIWAAPFVIAGLVALVGLVAAGASRNKILVASLVASIVAEPISFLSGIYGACSLGDCL